MSKKVRCVNIDWLEVHAYEPITQTLNADYYFRQGYNVHSREYGTRVYREMFTIYDNFENGILEIRRNPSSQGLNGIHAANECHIRLCNRTCYFDNAADLLHDFLEKHGYYDYRISRIDICMDFSSFDKGDNPQDFVRRYFRHRYAKINQGRIHSHGEDTWSGQEWNSLSWGSKTSPVSTKMYDKTMELYNAKLGTYNKPYIREAWLKCGMIDDLDRCTLNGEQQRIWRVEFSITSAVRNWVPIELDGKQHKYQSLHNTLDTYSTRERILVMFASLAQHYFRFKKYEEGQRKDRCKDKVLFDWQEVETVYKVGRNNTALGNGNKLFFKWNKLLQLLESFKPYLQGDDQYNAHKVLIDALKDTVMRGNANNSYSNEEINMLRCLVNLRMDHPEFSYDAAVEFVKRVLNISERTLPKHDS